MNFFDTEKPKVRVKKFDMQDDNDLMMYEKIHQKVKVDKETNWEIIEETKFSDKYCNVYILLKWQEPRRKNYG